jgi:hypothetical protein
MRVVKWFGTNTDLDVMISRAFAMIEVASARLAGLARSCAQTGTAESTARKVSRFGSRLLRALIA